MAQAANATATNDKFPPQIPFIIGNEAAERFSFYGMRNILTLFAIDYLLRNAPPEVRKSEGELILHWFVMGVYFFPLLGGYLADRYWGKYRTILWISLLYCVGHGLLAIFDDHRAGFYTGLFFIALGAGGIKPCVSVFAGDQFTVRNKHLLPKLFGLFYWSVNLGSVFASALMPKVLEKAGPKWAFGIPGILMGVATLIFWAGRRRYAVVPPTGANPHSFLKVLGTALKGTREKGRHWLDAALARHPREAVEGVKAVLRVLVVFLPVPFFWMLFDQKASTWVVQAKSMDLRLGDIIINPAQLQLVNPALVLLLIPITQKWVYPYFDRIGLPLKPLRKMTIGMFLAAASFAIVAVLQMSLDGGNKISVLWQVLPYALLTVAEILISITGLEFAYTQAPHFMKGTVTAFWNLAVSLGNFVVVLFKGRFEDRTASLLFFASITVVAGVVMGIIARWYQPTDFIRSGDAPAPPAEAPGEHVPAKPSAA